MLDEGQLLSDVITENVHVIDSKTNHMLDEGQLLCDIFCQILMKPSQDVCLNEILDKFENG